MLGADNDTFPRKLLVLETHTVCSCDFSKSPSGVRGARACLWSEPCELQHSTAGPEPHTDPDERVGHP